ncbi:hypothetical protein [Streptacidiphilus rugosus]|uniref:hypothetical protein n=1 Tax=Streptacidiphilus rugosus TaxID=405783 RepID=UPI00056152E8|nr:hypothetical protein [Streptacidiphilus rugosus]
MSDRNRRPHDGAPVTASARVPRSRSGSAPSYAPPAPRPNSRRKNIAGGLVFGVIGLLLVGGCALMLAYSTGLTGTPGQLRVDACAQVGSGRGQHLDCFGTFRSDDGRVVDQDAVLAHHYSPGTEVRVERSGGGTYYPVGPAGTAGALAGAGFGVMFLALAGGLFVQTSRRYPPVAPGQRLRTADVPRPLSVLLRALARTMLAALVLFVLFFVIALANGI